MLESQVSDHLDRYHPPEPPQAEFDNLAITTPNTHREARSRAASLPARHAPVTVSNLIPAAVYGFPGQLWGLPSQTYLIPGTVPPTYTAVSY